MSGMESAIREALDKAGIPGAQARQRIYEAARAALDRSLDRQDITDAARIHEHRQRLESLIADIEAEWTPPGGDAAAPPVSNPQHPAPDPAEAAWPAPERPVYDTSEALGPEQDGIDQYRPGNVAGLAGQTPPAAGSHAAAPVVSPVSQKPRSAAAPGGEAALDFVPDAGSHAAAAEPVAVPDAERPPHIEAPAPAAAKPARKVKLPKERKPKRRRGAFASIFSAAVMLSFLGIGVWWLIEVGALKSASERDTGVPNPPPSLSRDDFAGGPQQFNPGAGFSGEWANVFTPGRDGAPQIRGNASAEVIEQADGNVLRIISGSGDASGEVLVPLGADVMQAMAGRQSVLALTVRSASPDTTQIYVKCEFSVLGDCGRRRFDVTYETTDILFSLDYDRALAPNEGGNLVINSDISGESKGIDLLAVRIRPLN
ncbi:hypothetical protein [Hoeflea ulvae]|uniref:Biotin transporter BioY n=1 Tax=Hoeflea ulvae TaxID=2983764 RepID=A0ABT3YBT6_9HYPH|nr:hypothetical protein [Hoeflea ulvae]MCY0093343.1 hypothetical protein [Hoeflea ulvae]